MDGLRISISQTDMNRFSAIRRKIPHIVEDVRLKKSIGTLLSAQAKMNINEQSPDGHSAYKALDDKYVKYKGFATVLIGRKKDTVTKKGKKTVNKGVEAGVLKKSIDYQLGSRDIIYLTAINYAKYNQFGTKDIQARPIFTIRTDNSRQIMRFVTNAFNRIIKESV